MRYQILIVYVHIAPGAKFARYMIAIQNTTIYANFVGNYAEIIRIKNIMFVIVIYLKLSIQNLGGAKLWPLYRTKEWQLLKGGNIL